ncbi:MAG: SGNH/GDSL hydrolase family protein [Shewanella sp.]
MKNLNVVILCIALSVSSCAVNAFEQCVMRVDDNTLNGDYKKMGEYSFEQFGPSSIRFSKSEGNLTDKVLYDRKKINFNFDGLYKISNASNEWFFRFGGQAYEHDEIGGTFLYDVQWSDGRYPLEGGTYNVDVVLKKKNSNARFASEAKKIAMIGDSITWWQKGEYFRCYLTQAGLGFDFVGSRTDTFGFAHDGEGGNKTTDVLKRIKYIPVSDVYFLLIGTNDRYSALETADNIFKIARQLHKKNKKSTVVISTLLPRKDGFNQRNNDVNVILKRDISACSYCKLIDLGGKISKMNWEGLLESDGLHPNEKGYRELSDIIVNESHGF